MDDPAPAADRADRLRAADREAWEEFYGAVHPGLLAYARRRLPAEDAKDAVGEAVSRAVAAAERMPVDGHGPEAWIYGILRHVIVDAQRRSYRGRRILAGHHLGLLPAWTVDDDRMVLDQEALALRSAFSRLKPRDQEVLELRVLAGLDAAAVGAIVGLRAGAVRTAQQRALARLRAELERDGAPAPAPAPERRPLPIPMPTKVQEP